MRRSLCDGGIWVVEKSRRKSELLSGGRIDGVLKSKIAGRVFECMIVRAIGWLGKFVNEVRGMRGGASLRLLVLMSLCMLWLDNIVVRL